jgi:hypothetical protein
MAIYVLSSDPNAIDFGHAGLQARLVSALGAAVAVYRPYPFVEHSGFSETVREEIALVLANHPTGEPPSRAFDPFVSAWDLEEHLDRRVLALSGGWRKYLGLALFMNRPLPRRLLLDATSHLSDTRMRTLLARAAEQGDAIFCEYDPDLLLELQARTSDPLPPLRLLTDDGTTIREVSSR